MWIDWRCLFDFSDKGGEEPSWRCHLGHVYVFPCAAKMGLTKAHYEDGNNGDIFQGQHGGKA